MNTDNTANWWYASNNQKHGPFTWAELRELAQNGQIGARHLVWQRGMDDWVPASGIEGLVPDDLAPPLPASSAPDNGADTDQTQHSESGGFAAFAAPTAAKDADRLAADEQVEAFVGGNYSFYARQWHFAERNSISISWNWGAFLFGVLWMAYRKMYLPCAIFVATTLGIVAGAVALQLPPATAQAILQTTQIVFVLLFGLYGNLVYQWHVQRTLQRIASQYPPTQASHEIARQGGVSMISVLGVAMLILLAIMAMATLLPMVMDVPQA